MTEQEQFAHLNKALDKHSPRYQVHPGVGGGYHFTNFKKPISGSNLSYEAAKAFIDGLNEGVDRGRIWLEHQASFFHANFPDFVHLYMNDLTVGDSKTKMLDLLFVNLSALTRLADSTEED